MYSYFNKNSSQKVQEGLSIKFWSKDSTVSNSNWCNRRDRFRITLKRGRKWRGILSNRWQPSMNFWRTKQMGACWQIKGGKIYSPECASKELERRWESQETGPRIGRYNGWWERGVVVKNRLIEVLYVKQFAPVGTPPPSPTRSSEQMLSSRLKPSFWHLEKPAVDTPHSPCPMQSS